MGKTLLKMDDDWGYPCCRKPPYMYRVDLSFLQPDAFPSKTCWNRLEFQASWLLLAVLWQARKDDGRGRINPGNLEKTYHVTEVLNSMETW